MFPHDINRFNMSSRQQEKDDSSRLSSVLRPTDSPSPKSPKRRNKRKNSESRHRSILQVTRVIPKPINPESESRKYKNEMINKEHSK